MKIYELIDDEIKLSLGVMLYFEKSRDVIIELQESLDEWTAPFLFSNYVKENVYTIPRDVCKMWIAERVIPSGRQNINQILKTHKLKKYDEMKFLEISHGKCAQDSIYIKQIKELPQFVIERQEKNIVECVPVKRNTLLCFFQDESVRRIDLNSLTDDNLEDVLSRVRYDISKVIGNGMLFDTMSVGSAGYFITFNNSIDIPSDMLYEQGENVNVSLEEMLSFTKNCLVDTTTACEMLNCSRQNLSYLMKENKFQAIKNDVKGKLFLRSDIKSVEK